MKSEIHPNYRPVVFSDTSTDFSILTKSTIETNETIEWEDGNTYPLAKVEISSASHPFYTGTMRIVDTAGRVERFEKRYGRRKKKGKEEPVVEEAKAEAPQDAPEAKAEAAPEVEAKDQPKVKSKKEDRKKAPSKDQAPILGSESVKAKAPEAEVAPEAPEAPEAEVAPEATTEEDNS